MHSDKKKFNGLKLKVAESYKMDVGKEIVRIDTQSMEKLKLKSGDVVKIIGKDIVPAIIMRLRGSDEGLGIIRMDGITRMNANVHLGDEVTIEKVKENYAKRVEIAPTENIMLSGNVEEFFREKLMDKPVVEGMKIMVDIVGRRLYYIINSVKPKGISIITDMTDISITENVIKEKKKIPKITYEDIGGLKDAIYKIREMVELPLKHPELFERLGINPPKGVLLYGPPGCGKTLLAKAVANETDSNFYLINGPEIMSKYYGESEKHLRDIFEKAEKDAPSIIFIDEIDSIAPKRESVGGDVERRVVSQLLTLMDGLKGRGQVIVIAATNRPNDIDPALRRPGRFDREISIGVPNKSGRKEILQIHTRGMPLGNDVNLDEIAEVTRGFTGADIEVLCKEAALKSMRRILPDIENVEGKIPSDILKKLIIVRDDFVAAMAEVEPSAMREVIIETPKTKWEDIGGLEEAKQELIEAVEWPLKHEKSFRRIGIEPPKGVLLYGPPGCGKTLLARAAANESGANFIAVKGPEIFSKWVGESEKAIRKIFKKAKQVAPCIIFFDEIDSIAPKRGIYGGSHVTETVVNQILAEMDGIEKLEKVIVLGATNRPDIIDPALLRPGRFDRFIYIKMPDKEQRKKIFNIHTKKMPLDKDVKIDELAEKTEGYSGADIASICREAGMIALREDINAKKVKMKHFKKAMEKVKKSISDKELKDFERYENDFSKR